MLLLAIAADWGRGVPSASAAERLGARAKGAAAQTPEAAGLVATGRAARAAGDLGAARSALTATTQTLIAQSRARPRGQLELVSEPPDAEVIHSGQVIGHTPYRSPALVGLHALSIHKKGAVPEELRLIITEGQTTSARVTLTVIPVPPVPPAHPTPPLVRVAQAASPSPQKKPRSLVRSPWLWTLIGLATAGAATGLGVGLAARSPDVTGVPSGTFN